MHHVNKNSPTPAILKAAFSAVFLLSAVFHFSPLPLSAQAMGQLGLSAPAVEIPLATPPANATLYRAGPGLNVYFINVGQGDAIYIELPGGKNALIDGGPSRSATGSLAKFLSEKKVSAIDHVILTHPHSDHYNGLQYVFSNMTVGNFYDTRVDNKGAKADDTLRDQVRSIGVSTFYPAPGERLDWSAPGVDVKVFNSCPEAFTSSKSETLNNCSIMLKLTYNGSSLLFTGDTEGETEELLASRYGDELRAGVLKVGHHGSKYSSTTAFLKAVKPARAYIEVGKNNYGHPTQDALGRLLSSGAEVFRTDLDDTQAFSMAGSHEAE